jgi:hypothetical protein
LRGDGKAQVQYETSSLRATHASLTD